MNFAAFIAVLLTSLALVIFFSPLSIKMARILNAVDTPTDRSVHSTPIPRLGGLALSLTILMCSVLFIDPSPYLFGMVAGLVVILLTGLVDDLHHLSARSKIFGEAVAISIFCWASGCQLDSLGNLFGFGPIQMGYMAFPFTILILVGVINAINLIDGLDALASGIVAIAAFFYALLALLIGDGTSLLLATIVMGTSIGFMFFNRHPARVFMGDCGSLVLGYMLAVLAISLYSFDGSLDVRSMTTTLIIFFPALDALVVMIRRLLAGKGAFLPDKTHFHHRLLHSGFSQRSAVSLIYGITTLFGVLAFVLFGQVGWRQLLIALGLSLAIYLILHLYEQRKEANAPSGLQLSASRPQAIGYWASLLFLFLTLPLMLRYGM